MTKEQKFKVGDWVVENKTNEIKQITLGINEDVDRKIALYTRLCSLWQPKPDEYVWYGYELVQVIDNYDTIKICRQNSDIYEDVTLDKLEPFIGTLPSFIKDTE